VTESLEALSSAARDHIIHPRNRGQFDAETSGSVIQGETGSQASGAYVRFHLQLVDGRIEAARYELLGPPELIAAASRMSELLAGREARVDCVPTGLEVARELALARSTHGYALLVEDSVLACLRANV
jgi:hypothetical protein